MIREIKKCSLLIVFLAAFASHLTFAQSQPGDGKRYSSLDGLYAVTIPASVKSGGGGPLEKEFTIGLGHGYSSYWNGTGVYLQAGYVNFHKEETTPNLADRLRLFSEAVTRLKTFRAEASGLKLERESRIKVNGIEVTDLIFEGPGGRLHYRLLPTEKSIVRITAAYSTETARQVATMFLDSIETPSRAAIVAEKIREATPSALPQCDPKIPILVDVVQMKLRGRVRSVVVEREDIKEVASTRFLREELDFDASGRLIKELNYEPEGRPDTVRVFGCIDGKRVSISGYASYENRFSAWGPVRPGAKPRDTRFTSMYEIHLDDEGRLSQKKTFGNDSLLYTTVSYSYKVGLIESISVDSDDQVSSRSETTLDSLGREKSMTNRRFGSGGIEWRNTYRFIEFDEKGNWTKRSGLYELIKNGEVSNNSNFTEYRTISYHK